MQNAKILKLAIVALAICSLVASAQDKGFALQEKINVTQRLIDVMVVDRDGNFINNLSREDFQIFVNKKPVEISSFEVYQSEPQVFESDKGLASSDLSMPGRKMVLFFDFGFSRRIDVNNARDASIEFITNNFRENDQIMLVSYGRSLKILHTMTNDKQKLLETVNNLFFGSERTQLSLANNSTTTATDSIRSENEGEDPEGDTNVEESMDTSMFEQSVLRGNIAEETHRIRNYLRSLESLSRYLKMIPGKKSLILFSSGFNPFRSKTDLLANALDVEEWMSTEDNSVTSDMKDIYSVFNDSNTSIFTVDLTPLQERSSLSYIKRQSLLKSFSTETGGVYYIAGNNILNRLVDIDTDTSNYYLFGIRVENPEIKFQKLTVEVNNPQYRVLHRSGFQPPKKFERLNADDRVLHLEEGFFAGRTVSEMEMNFSSFIFPYSGNESSLMISVDLPLSKVGNQEYEILAQLQDSEGNLMDVLHSTYTFDATNRSSFVLSQTLRMGKGEHVLKVAVRDNKTGERNYLFQKVTLTDDSNGVRVSGLVFAKKNESVVEEKAIKEKSLKSKYYKELRNVRAADPLSVMNLDEFKLYSKLDGSSSNSAHVIFKLSGLAEDQIANLQFEYLSKNVENESFLLNIKKSYIAPLSVKGEVLVYALLDIQEVPPGDYSFYSLIKHSEENQILIQMADMER